MSRGPKATYVSTIEELRDIVAAVKASGEFVFDVETRGNVNHHADILTYIDEEWKVKQAELKSTNEGVIARSRQAIVDRWQDGLGLDTFRNEVFWIGIAIEGRSWAIPMGHPNGEVLVKEQRGDGSTIPPPGYRKLLKNGNESLARGKYFIPATFSPPPDQLTQEQVFTELEAIFMDPSIVKINQNIKFDAKSIAKYYGGKLPEGDFIDILDLMHIVNENLRSYNLQSILDHLFRFDPYKRDGKLGKTLVYAPFSAATRYVHYDVRWTWLAYRRLWRTITQYPTLTHAAHIDIPTIRVVAQMEMNGIPVNRREMKKLGVELDVKANEALRDLSQYAPIGFNPNSTDDKIHFLFGKKSEGGLGLKVGKMTDGGKSGNKKPSVEADELKKFKGQHPAVDYMLAYAEVKKMKSTYVDGMYNLLFNVPGQKHLGIVHPQFHFHRTVTGRFSSSDPNLQNIPRDGRMRSLFVALPGDHLLVADYSQIEMRIMAMYSQDEKLLEIFANDIDVHTGTASVILGRPPADSEERNIYGKVPNFLMGYGGGAKKLMESTNGAITLERAQFIVDGYNNGYAGLTTWKNRVINRAKKLEYVETMGGRRRRLPELNADRSTKEGWRAATGAERQAINAIVQGTAAEICKEAMVRVSSSLEYPKCKMLVQVHDELVMSVPSTELGLWIPEVNRAMGNGTTIGQGLVKEPVKLVVDAHAAGSWADAKGG